MNGAEYPDIIQFKYGFTGQMEYPSGISYPRNFYPNQNYKVDLVIPGERGYHLKMRTAWVYNVPFELLSFSKDGVDKL